MYFLKVYKYKLCYAFVVVVHLSKKFKELSPIFLSSINRQLDVSSILPISGIQKEAIINFHTFQSQI